MLDHRHNVNTANIYFDNKVIAWCKEFCYLGLTIVSAKIFKCNLHNAKLKFFRSINGILGKMGSKPNINVTLSLIAAHCNPVLFYGTESIRLNQIQMNSLCYTFNYAYLKLFNSSISMLSLLVNFVVVNSLWNMLLIWEHWSSILN